VCWRRKEKPLYVADFHLIHPPRNPKSGVVRLLRDANLRAGVAANGRRLVAERYDWAAVMPRFLKLVEQCVER